MLERLSGDVRICLELPSIHVYYHLLKDSYATHLQMYREHRSSQACSSVGSLVSGNQGPRLADSVCLLVLACGRQITISAMNPHFFFFFLDSSVCCFIYLPSWHMSVLRFVCPSSCTNTGTTDVHTCAHVAPGDLNSGLHICVASALFIAL